LKSKKSSRSVPEKRLENKTKKLAASSCSRSGTFAEKRVARRILFLFHPRFTEPLRKMIYGKNEQYR
jgi:hypothetical protein